MKFNRLFSSKHNKGKIRESSTDIVLRFMTFMSFFFLSTQRNDTKTSRVRTNYKLRVGEKPIGRYTEYSQVRIPPTDDFGTEDAQKYYRHPKVSVYITCNQFYSAAWLRIT